MKQKHGKHICAKGLCLKLMNSAPQEVATGKRFCCGVAKVKEAGC